MRRYVVTFISFVLFLSAIAVMQYLQTQEQEQLRGYVNPTRSAELPYKVARQGVLVDLLNTTEIDIESYLQQLSQTNIIWLHQRVSLQELATNSAVWDALDTLTGRITSEQRLKLLIAFEDVPTSQQTASFVQAMTQFVSRYGHSVDTYQITQHPRTTLPDYLQWLTLVYPLIHQLDAQATVLAHLPAPSAEIPTSDLDRLNALYRDGLSKNNDGIAVEFLLDPSTLPNDRQVSADHFNLSRLILLREAMIANGDARKALWVTGLKTTSVFDNPEDYLDYWLGAIARIEREWAWLGSWIPHHTPEELIGIGERYPYTTSPDIARNGLFHPKHLTVAYSGLWTWTTAQGADIGWLETSDSWFSFAFLGREVALLLNKDDYFAFLYPRIGGQKITRLPTDADGNPYILLRSASGEPAQSLVLIENALPLQQHALQAVADKGWDRWAIAGFAVSDGDLHAPYHAARLIAQIALFLSGFSLFVALYQLPIIQLLSKLMQTLQQLKVTQALLLAAIASLVAMLGILEQLYQHTPVLRREVTQWGLGALLSSSILFLELPAILVMGALLILFSLILVRLEIGLALTLLWLPFFLFPVELYRFAFPMSELVLIITFVAWLLRQISHWRTFKISAGWLDGVVLLWCVVATLALTWSQNRSVAFTDWRVMFIEPVLFYVMIRTYVQTRQTQTLLVHVLVVSGILMSIIGIVQFGMGQSIITAESGAYRLAGVYGSPNNVALFITRLFPFVLFYIFQENTRTRWLWVLCAGILAIATVLTQSVGGLLIGLPVGIVVTLLLYYRQRALVPLAITLAVSVLMVAVFVGVSPRFAKLLDLAEGTNFIRIRVWESSLHMVQDYPLTGVGLDQFLYAFRGTYVKPDAIWDPDLSHPHNILLDFWLRLGVLGVGLLTILVISFVKTAYTAYQRHAPNEIIPIIAAMVASVAYGMIDNSFFVNDLVLILMLLLGFTANLARKY